VQKEPFGMAAPALTSSHAYATVPVKFVFLLEEVLEFAEKQEKQGRYKPSLDLRDN